MYAEFPAYHFHPTDAREGRRVNSAEDLAALGPGWVDDPRKFDPNFVPPPQPEVGSMPADAAARGFSVKEFPAFLFHPQLAREGRRFNTAEDTAELGDGWVDSPDFGGAPAPSAPVAAKPAPPVATRTAGEPTDEEKNAAAVLAKKAAELHATSVEDALKALEGADEATLRRVQEMEAINPDAPRATLLRGVGKLLAALKTS